MSYAAEPYAQFVDDLLTGLTGGVVREGFAFLPENAPFRLAPPGALLPASVRVHGQSDAAYRRFLVDRDYAVDDVTVVWLAREDGTPAADAVWPDEGTTFHVAYEHRAFTGAAPRLTDRNVGSVTRLLAESFAREYAVLSQQMQSVYEAGFLDTAGGRDLGQLVRLVGLERRGSTVASGSAVFARTTPAPADIFIPAGARLSASEPPGAVFETLEPGTLRRGGLSVEVPIQALTPGNDAVVPAGSITVIHQPILGVASVGNPQPTRLGSGEEPDEALRSRARRALETSGQATRGAILGALTTVAGIREKDVRISEDHLQNPGVVRVDVVAPSLDAAHALRAVAAIEAARPAGIRVIHNIEVGGDPEPAVGTAPLLSEPAEEGFAPVAVPDAEAHAFPVGANVIVVPISLSLTTQERGALKADAEQAVRAYIDAAGVGETLVYHALVARLMALDGVLDVDVALFVPGADPPSTRRRNLQPADPARRAVLAREADLLVEVGGAPLALDVKVTVTLKDAGLVGDRQMNLDAARLELLAALEQVLRAWPADRELSKATLGADVAAIVADTWSGALSQFKADFVEAGVRILRTDPTLTLSGLERMFVTQLTITDGGAV